MSGQTYRLAFFGISDKGLKRGNNEDHFMVADLTRRVIGVLDNRVLPELLDHEVGPQGTLLAVADGLGGYEDGEHASRIAVESMTQALFDATLQVSSLREQLSRAVEVAHQAICLYRCQTLRQAQMASTLTAMHIGHGLLTIAHVGDSRAYLFRHGILRLLTEDQTVVNLMQKKGILTDEEARRHPSRHAILQALGQDTVPRPTLHTYPFQDGDLVLLCTDGLSSYVLHDQIHDTLALEEDEPGRCRRLLEAAYATGAADNITVLLARLTVDQGEIPPGASR
jgi:serine/threonine protein phosphatase PrpC